MEHTLSTATKKSPRARLIAYPLVQIVLGMVLTFAPVPLTMIIASKLVEKSYRILWPQLLAAVLVWFGYRFMCVTSKNASRPNWQCRAWRVNWDVD